MAITILPFLCEKDLRLGKVGDTEAAVRMEIVDGITRVYAETAQAAKESKLGCPVIATGHLIVAGSTASECERDIHIGHIESDPINWSGTINIGSPRGLVCRVDEAVMGARVEFMPDVPMSRLLNQKVARPGKRWRQSSRYRFSPSKS